jgi:hypothetical protein
MDCRGKGDLRVEGFESYGLGFCVIAMEEKKMGWGGEVVRRGWSSLDFLFELLAAWEGDPAPSKRWFLEHVRSQKNIEKWDTRTWIELERSPWTVFENDIFMVIRYRTIGLSWTAEAKASRT